jgi:hypothetical protein
LEVLEVELVVGQKWRTVETPFVCVFCTGENRVVKITCSTFEMVLRTTKHTMIYPGSGPSLEVIALHLVIWYWRWTGVTNGWAESSRSSCGEGGNGSCAPFLKGRGIL